MDHIDADVDDDVQASEVVNDEPAPEPSRRSSRSTQGQRCVARKCPSSVYPDRSQRSKSRFGHDDAISDLSELDEKPTPRRRQPKAKQRYLRSLIALPHCSFNFSSCVG